MTFVFTEKHVLTHYVSYSSKICVSTFSKTNVSDSRARSGSRPVVSSLRPAKRNSSVVEHADAAPHMMVPSQSRHPQPLRVEIIH